jgi:hypothetical protein
MQDAWRMERRERDRGVTIIYEWRGDFENAAVNALHAEVSVMAVLNRAGRSLPGCPAPDRSGPGDGAVDAGD